jgi:NADH:ubiquinone oxidoreductase subunit H
VTGWGGLGGLVAAVRVRVGYAWVWLRATFPRYRYDILIALAWKSILPATLIFLLFFLVLVTINL